MLLSAALADSRVAACLSSSPALKAAKILELEIVELDKLAEIKGGLLVAEIEGRKPAGLAAKVRKRDVGFVPILKRQLALDTAIVRRRNDRHGVTLVVPRVLLAYFDLCRSRQASRAAEERDGEFILGIGKPGARAIIHHDVPLVPSSLVVLIENAANHDERFIAIDAFRIELNRRTVRRKIGYLTDFLEVDVRAHQNALAILANRLNAAGPLEDNFCAAIGTVRDGLSHRPLLTGSTKKSSLETLVASRLMTRHFVGTRKPSHGNDSRLEKLLKRGFEIPFRARQTAKQIQAE